MYPSEADGRGLAWSPDVMIFTLYVYVLQNDEGWSYLSLLPCEPAGRAINCSQQVHWLSDHDQIREPDCQFTCTYFVQRSGDVQRWHRRGSGLMSHRQLYTALSMDCRCPWSFCILRLINNIVCEINMVVCCPYLWSCPQGILQLKLKGIFIGWSMVWQSFKYMSECHWVGYIHIRYTVQNSDLHSEHDYGFFSGKIVTTASQRPWSICCQPVCHILRPPVCPKHQVHLQLQTPMPSPVLKQSNTYVTWKPGSHRKSFLFDWEVLFNLIVHVV